MTYANPFKAHDVFSSGLYPISHKRCGRLLPLTARATAEVATVAATMEDVEREAAAQRAKHEQSLKELSSELATARGGELRAKELHKEAAAQQHDPSPQAFPFRDQARRERDRLCARARL